MIWICREDVFVWPASKRFSDVQMGVHKVDIYYLLGKRWRIEAERKKGREEGDREIENEK